MTKATGERKYRGYVLKTTRTRSGVLATDVFDPRFPGKPPVFSTKTLVQAYDWVDSYIRGAIRATQERTGA